MVQLLVNRHFIVALKIKHMKKTLTVLMLVSICFCFGFKAHAPLSTWYYSGGSGPQIVVTQQGSQLVIGQNSYDQPLRVDWFTPNGTYSEAVYGSTFYPYSNYNFRISGHSTGNVPPPGCPSCPPNTYSSDSYYNYY